MALQRAKLVQHLENLHLGGQIKEVVVTGKWESAAMDVDQQLIVLLPPLSGMETLPDSVGVLDLDVVIKSLRQMGKDGDVGLTFEDDRIIVSEKGGARVSFVTGDIATIPTRIEHTDTVEGARAAVVGGTEVALDQTTAEGIVEMYGLLNRPPEITIHVVKGKKSTGEIQVGHSDSHNARFSVKGLCAEGGAYEIAVDGDRFTKVLKRLTDFAKARLVLTGPDALVAVREGEYMWLLSPLAEDDAALVGAADAAAEDAAAVAVPVDDEDDEDEG